jgi:hypothetical protein
MYVIVFSLWYIIYIQVLLCYVRICYIIYNKTSLYTIFFVIASSFSLSQITLMLCTDVTLETAT